MTLPLTAMRRLLRKGLGGLDAVDLPDAEADELLNMALWEVEDRFDFEEKECIVTASTVIGQREYELPNTLDALISVSIQDPTELTWKKLGRMSQHRLDEIQDSSTDARGRPRLYLRRDNALVLEPIPDEVLTVRLFMLRTIESLLEGTFDTTQLPRNWDEIVVEGAVARGHFYNQDYTLARQAANFPIAKERGAVLEKHKEEKFDSRYARLNVLWDDPVEE